DASPTWHPNGRALAVKSQKPDGTRGIILKEPGGAERLLVDDTGKPGPTSDGLSWSADGAVLAYVVSVSPRGGTDARIWVSATGTAPNPPRLFKGPATSEFSPAFSPDGRWLACVSNQSGRNEVYVEAYPHGDRFPVSTTGGGGPVWRGDGKEIFFQ